MLRIQPDEGITLQFERQGAGAGGAARQVDDGLLLRRLLRRQPTTGYETLLYDCMIGDATLFQRADVVELGWSVVQPVLDVWQALPPRRSRPYPAGSWGPAGAEALLRRDGRAWREPVA